MVETHTNGVVRDVFVYDLRDWYAKYSANTAVEEHFQFFCNVSRSTQLSHPHSARLTGMAQNIRYLLWTLMALSAQKYWRDPIADEA